MCLHLLRRLCRLRRLLCLLQLGCLLPGLWLCGLECETVVLRTMPTSQNRDMGHPELGLVLVLRLRLVLALRW